MRLLSAYWQPWPPMRNTKGSISGVAELGENMCFTEWGFADAGKRYEHGRWMWRGRKGERLVIWQGWVPSGEAEQGGVLFAKGCWRIDHFGQYTGTVPFVNGWCLMWIDGDRRLQWRWVCMLFLLLCMLHSTALWKVAACRKDVITKPNKKFCRLNETACTTEGSALCSGAEIGGWSLAHEISIVVRCLRHI